LTLIALMGVSVTAETLIDGDGGDPGGSAFGRSEPSTSATAARSVLVPTERSEPTPVETLALSPSPPAPTSAPSAAPVAAGLGPDCMASGDSLGRAHDLMDGRLVLSRHGAFQLPKDPSWSEDPFNDRNWEFQYHSLRFTWDLFEAWRQTGDTDYRDRGLFLVRDWVRDNPRAGGRSDFSWNDHSTAWRTVVLACAAVIRPSSDRIRAALTTHGALLADPGFYVDHGNHALNQNRGLLAAGCVLGRREWQQLATIRISMLIEESIDADGVTNEQAVFYQLYNLQAYRAASDRLEACGIETPAAFRRLDRMTQMLTHATLPDGTYATLGDTAHTRATPIAGTTAEYAASGGLRGPKPARTFALFDAGFAFGRTGWGENRAFEDEVVWTARFGPGQRFHGHRDHGSVTLYGYGHRLVDDPGLFTGNADRWRAFALGRSAHNVITVDGVPYDRAATADLVRVATTETHDDVTIHDPGYPDVDLQRRVVFSRGLGWLLIDDRAHAASVRTYRQLWHLLPDADPRRNGAVIRSCHTGGNVHVIQLVSPDSVRVVEGRRSPPQGWYSKDLNRREPAPTIEAIATGRTVRYVTLLVPVSRCDSDVALSNVSVTTGGVRFVLSVDGVREQATIARDHATVVVVGP
jgi:Heparinase II/III-like protein/Heparinase II/III N-terminus